MEAEGYRFESSEGSGFRVVRFQTLRGVRISSEGYGCACEERSRNWEALAFHTRRRYRRIASVPVQATSGFEPQNRATKTVFKERLLLSPTRPACIHPIPHGGVRPFHRKSTRITQSGSGSHAVHIWSRNARFGIASIPVCFGIASIPVHQRVSPCAVLDQFLWVFVVKK